MTERVLAGRLKFGNRECQLRQKKMRVISKAIGSARPVDNLAGPDRIDHNRVRISGASNQDQDADIPSGASLACELAHQLKVIAPIDGGLRSIHQGCRGFLTCREVLCKSGAANPRCPVQCNRTQARIIGQRRQTSPLTRMSRLE